MNPIGSIAIVLILLWIWYPSKTKHHEPIDDEDDTTGFYNDNLN